MNKTKTYNLHIQPPKRSLVESMNMSPEELVVKEVEFKSPIPEFYMFDLIYTEIRKYINRTGEDPTILYIDSNHYKCLMAELAEKEKVLKLLNKITIHDIELTICICTLGLGVAGPASRDFIVVQQNELYKEVK